MYVDPNLHLRYETNLVMMYDLLNMFLSLVCKYFIGNMCVNAHGCMCVCVHWGNWPIVLLFVVSLSGFGVRVILSLY